MLPYFRRSVARGLFVFTIMAVYMCSQELRMMHPDSILWKILPVSH